MDLCTCLPPAAVRHVFTTWVPLGLIRPRIQKIIPVHRCSAFSTLQALLWKPYIGFFRKVRCIISLRSCSVRFDRWCACVCTRISRVSRFFVSALRNWAQMTPRNGCTSPSVTEIDSSNAVAVPEASSAACLVFSVRCWCIFPSAAGVSKWFLPAGRSSEHLASTASARPSANAGGVAWPCREIWREISLCYRVGGSSLTGV